MDSQELELLKKISKDIEMLRDEVKSVYQRISKIEGMRDEMDELHKEVDDVGTEMNRYFELRNTGN